MVCRSILTALFRAKTRRLDAFVLAVHVVGNIA